MERGGELDDTSAAGSAGQELPPIGREPTPGAEPASGPPAPPGAPGMDRPLEGAAWLLFALTGFVAGSLFGTLFVALAAALSGSHQSVSSIVGGVNPPAWAVIVELVGAWTGFLGGTILASWLRGSGSLVRDMGLRFRRSDVVLGPVVGILGQWVLLPLVYLPLRPFVSHLDQRLGGPANQLTGGFPGWELVVIGALTVLVVPVVEELLFRGVLLRGLLSMTGKLGRVAGPGVSVIGCGLLFGLAHAEALQLLGLASFGVVLSVLAWRTGRLGPGILAHGSFNLMAVVAVALSRHG